MADLLDSHMFSKESAYLGTEIHAFLLVPDPIRIRISLK